MSERRCGPYVYRDGIWHCVNCNTQQDVTRQANVSDDIQHLFEVYGANAVRVAVSQEGGPATAESFRDVMTPGVSSSGSPSCNSELEAIRYRATHDLEKCTLVDRRTLLRRVDELTEERDRHLARADKADRLLLDSTEREGKLGDLTAAFMKERDELRAKLAERDHLLSARAKAYFELEVKLADSERAWNMWNTNMSIEASKWEQKCGELEGDLRREQEFSAGLMRDLEDEQKEHTEARVKLAEAERRDDELCEVISMLKGQEADEKRRADSNGAVAGMLTKERDELRAKLAEQATEIQFLAERKNAHFAQAMANGKSCQELEAKLAALTDWTAAEEERHHDREKELEAKLAEAEADAQRQLDDEHLSAFVAMKKRAEAAEARVKFLEQEDEPGVAKS
jgi:hypothetical protein